MNKAYTTTLLIIFIIMIITMTPRLVQSVTCNNVFTLCSQCSNMTKGGPSSATFKENLKALLLSFPTANQTEVGYYNMTKGGTKPDDKVTVIALCRGDLSEVDCQTCLNDAATSILQTCPSQKEAIIWGEKCTVQYSNDSTFHHMDKEPLLVLESPNKYTDVGAETFNARLKSLIDDLTINASSSVGKYASGSVNVTASRSIYSLVQCLPSLSQKECSDCLHESSSKIPGGVDGARVLKPACTLRYENAIFYNVAAQVSPTTNHTSSGPSTAPVSPTTNHTSSGPSTETDGKKNSKDKIIIPLLSSMIGVVVLGMLVHGFT